MLGGEVDKAGADGLANEILRGGVRTLFGDLHLKLARAEAQVHDFVTASLALSDIGGDRIPARAVVRLDAGVVLTDLIPSGDA